MAKKAVFIISQKKFQEIELFIPKQIIESRGFEVKIAAQSIDQAISKTNKIVNPDLAVNEIKTEDFDAIVFIGGQGAVEYFGNKEVFKLAQNFIKENKIVAAICIAPSILANAGILLSKTVTAHPSQEENIRSRGAFYTGMSVEVDDKIITGKNPDAAKEFGEKIAYLLEE